MLCALVSNQASAFVQTQTCLPSGDFMCAPGEEARGLFWPSSCVTYHLHEAGHSELDQEETFTALRASFEAWNEPECSYLNLKYGGLTDESTVQFNQRNLNENVNLVVFREEGWAYSPGVLALTSVTFDPTQGIIYDSDMEINAQDYSWSVSEEGVPGRIDLRNTITHEAGHFLGLDHSGVAAATMAASAPPGETKKRSLDEDDIEGLCSIYPSGSPVTDACIGAPEGFYTSTGEAQAPDPTTTTVTSGGCTTTGQSPGSPLAPLGLLAMAGLVLTRRRRTVTSLGGVTLGALALLALSATPSLAFERTQTCTLNGSSGVTCAAGEEPRFVYWPSACVSYHINDKGSTDTDNNRAFTAIQAGFDRWGAPDAGPECSYLSLVFAGYTDEDRVGYNPYTGGVQNANIVVFRDDVWDSEAGILALTSVTFRPSTGEIVDADIELNGVDYNFTTTNDENRVIIDVFNTIAHEAGHFLGLDHSANEEATMFSTAPVRETKKRSLDRDDVEGLCAIYPSTNTPPRSVCLGGPEGFFQRPLYGPGDGSPPPEAKHCECATPTQHAPMWPASLVLLGALVWSVRRRD